MAEPFEHACGKCPRVFKTAVGLGSHQKAHMPAVTCEICGVESKNIEAHKRKEHPSETSNSDTERNLRSEIVRLRGVIERRDAENRALRGKLAQAIRQGAVRA